MQEEKTQPSLTIGSRDPSTPGVRTLDINPSLATLHSPVQTPAVSIATTNSTRHAKAGTEITEIADAITAGLDSGYRTVWLRHRDRLEEQLGPGIIPFETQLATRITERGGNFRCWSKTEPVYRSEIYEVVERDTPSTHLAVDRRFE